MSVGSGSPDQNRATVLRLLDECFNCRNAEIFDEIAHPDLVFHLAGYPEPFRGIEAVKAWARSYHSAFDTRLEVEDSRAVGDVVVVRWTMRVTHKGEYLGVPPTHMPATISALEWFQLVDGLCIEVWNMFDTLGVVQQLGVLPTGTPPRALLRLIFRLKRLGSQRGGRPA